MKDEVVLEGQKTLEDTTERIIRIGFGESRVERQRKISVRSTERKSDSCSRHLKSIAVERIYESGSQYKI